MTDDPTRSAPARFTTPRPLDAPTPVLSLGETLIDLIVADGAPRLEDASAFAARPGGAPANVAVALARLGVPSAFGGVVGADPFGTRLRATLEGEGVDVSRLRATDTADTSLAFAWKDARGDGHFRLLRMADRLLSPVDVEAARLFETAALVVGSVALAAEPSRAAVTRAVELATVAAIPVCFDVNLRPTLWPDLAVAREACAPILAHATLLKLSLDDARHLFGAADDPVTTVERLRSTPDVVNDEAGLSGRSPAHHRRVVVLTDGDRGCWYAPRVDEAGSRSDVPVRYVRAFQVEAVEPTGAGDAFTAGLISRLISRGWSAPEEDDIRYAAAAGALATTRPGAMDGLPTAAELDAFLTGR